MVYKVCRESLDGIWDPSKTPGIGEIDSSDLVVDELGVAVEDNSYFSQGSFEFAASAIGLWKYVRPIFTTICMMVDV